MILGDRSCIKGDRLCFKAFSHIQFPSIRNETRPQANQIDAFDEFGGDKNGEISQNCLKVYLIENKVVGYISTVDESCLCGHPLLCFLSVHPQYHRQGIASQLLIQVETQYSGQNFLNSF